MSEITYTFKYWLSKFIKVDLPIGDLARQFSNNEHFPNIDDYDALHDYVLDNSKIYGTTRCFEEVWKFYKATAVV